MSAGKIGRNASGKALRKASAKVGRATGEAPCCCVVVCCGCGACCFSSDSTVTITFPTITTFAVTVPGATVTTTQRKCDPLSSESVWFFPLDQSYFKDGDTGTVNLGVYVRFNCEDGENFHSYITQIPESLPNTIENAFTIDPLVQHTRRVADICNGYTQTDSVWTRVGGGGTAGTGTTTVAINGNTCCKSGGECVAGGAPNDDGSCDI